MGVREGSVGDGSVASSFEMMHIFSLHLQYQQKAKH